MSDIDELHARLGSADSLGEYFRALHGIGVVRFDSFLTDGHSEFVGPDGHRVVSSPYHDVLEVADHADPDAVVEHLRRHAEGVTSYVQMSTDLAASGVATWVADTSAMTMTYCDHAGAALLTEQVD